MRGLPPAGEPMKPEDAQTNKPHESLSTLNRRSFLRTGTAGIGALAASSSGLALNAHAAPSQSSRPSSFLDLIRTPDSVTVFESFQGPLPAGAIRLQRHGENWTGGQVAVESKVDRGALVLTLQAPSAPVALVHVRWHANPSPRLKILGDAWERSYGDLGWRNIIPERVLPWYFGTTDGSTCHAYGVKTGARSLCFWQLDPEGISLWLNLSNGGSGVKLGQRVLAMASVVTRHGIADEPAIDSVAALCKAMCARATRSIAPIYGANDWCYSYGQSSAESILRDTEFIVSVSPSAGVRPFSVIDGG